MFEPPLHLHSCCRVPWAWTQRSRHWGRDRPWQSSSERATWPGCSHLGTGMVSEGRHGPPGPHWPPHTTMAGYHQSPLPHSSPALSSACATQLSPTPHPVPALTSLPQPPAAWGFSPALVSAGSPAASEPVPDSLSVPFPGMPRSAAALQVKKPRRQH